MKHLKKMPWMRFSNFQFSFPFVFGRNVCCWRWDDVTCKRHPHFRSLQRTQRLLNKFKTIFFSMHQRNIGRIRQSRTDSELNRTKYHWDIEGELLPYVSSIGVRARTMYAHKIAHMCSGAGCRVRAFRVELLCAARMIHQQKQRRH